MTWMAWTLPTALFFLTIAAALFVMTFSELRWPSVTRKGFLPLSTSRGDRFFIALLGSAFVHAGWLALSDGPVLVATVLCLLLGGVLMRWG